MIENLKALYIKHLAFNTDNAISIAIQDYLANKPSLLASAPYKEFFEEISLRAAKEIETHDELKERIRNVQDQEALKTLLFKENGMAIDEASVQAVKKLRYVDITENVQVITDPLKEVLFTSNVMLTLPKDRANIAEKYSSQIDFEEAQSYWFDHPIPLDIKEESNEILYGLKHLNQSVAYEIKGDYRVKVALSVSCTHKSLKRIAKAYLLEKLDGVDLKHLDIYIFTENECEELIDMLYPDQKDTELYTNIKHTIGVDGKYGRHYSFLKAIGAFFGTYVDTNIKATYKIDLDQVFDQEKMKAYTGSYALEKLVNNRLGAYGVDRHGNKVKLGMLAGYLINDVDIDKSMYEPDVAMPSDDLNYEQYVFNSGRPQYISSLAEMLGKEQPDTEATLRYHITGGMNGVLIQDLIAYKPFTPSFITRAEDQAFMLSIVNKSVNGTYLRCYHQHGFFMRHDKGTFLEEDLKHFEVPKKVGDYERILLFSHYAKDILNSYARIKDEIQPFTGSFITDHPYTTILFRVLFAAYELAKKDLKDAYIFLDSVVERLPKIMQNIDDNTYSNQYKAEKMAWDYYYDTLGDIDLTEEAVQTFVTKTSYQR